MIPPIPSMREGAILNRIYIVDFKRKNLNDVTWTTWKQTVTYTETGKSQPRFVQMIS